MADKLSSCAKHESKTIVYAAFKGMGDLLCASPVIAAELAKGHIVKLLLFPGSVLSSFVESIEFGANRHNLSSFQLPVPGGLTRLLSFVRQMASFRPDLIWISPHASREASSWKIPLLLWAVKMLYWPHAVLAGARNERLSILFDLTVPLDRSLPYAKREWVAYSHLNGAMPGNLPGSMRFIEKIRLHREKPPRYDLLITPGANAINRLWPLSHYVSLVHMIPRNYRIAVAGLPDDIAKMQRALPKDRQIQFLAGTLEEAICAIAQSRAVLTMDSGSMHFASALNVPGITLFGKDDPASVISTGESILPIYERKFPCQPCRSVHCSQPEVYCMNSILPETVAKALINLLKSSATDVAVTA